MDLAGSKRKREDDERSSDGSDDGSDLKSFIAPDEDDKTEATHDSEENVAELLAPEVTGTVVGGRVLRDRKAMKPVERYFDTETYKRLLEQDEARDMLVLLRKWSEAGSYTPSVPLTKRTPYEVIVREYRAAKQAMELSDTDDESTEVEEEEDSTAEEEEDETESDSDEESEDEEEEEEEEEESEEEEEEE